MNKPKLVVSSAFSAIITIVFVVVIVIWAELFPPLKEWLKNFSGHHWTSKSIFSVLIYSVGTVLLYLFPNKYSGDYPRKSLGLLLVFTLLGTLVLALFFTAHYFRFFML